MASKALRDTLLEELISRNNLTLGSIFTTEAGDQMTEYFGDRKVIYVRRYAKLEGWDILIPACASPNVGDTLEDVQAYLDLKEKAIFASGMGNKEGA